MKKDLYIQGDKDHGDKLKELLEALLGSKILDRTDDPEVIFHITSDRMPCLKEFPIKNLPIGIKYYTYSEFIKWYPLLPGDSFKLNGDYRNYTVKKIKWDKKLGVMYLPDSSDNTWLSVGVITGRDEIDDTFISDILDLCSQISPVDHSEVIRDLSDRIVAECEKSKIKMSYPKDYDKCSELVDIKEMSFYCPKNFHYAIKPYLDLLVYRDAWWKVYGDWKPDWTDNTQEKYCLDLPGNRKSNVIVFPEKKLLEVFVDIFEPYIETAIELL